MEMLLPKVSKQALFDNSAINRSVARLVLER
jgi:hypothetical protein